MSLAIDYSRLNRLIGRFLAHKVISTQRTEGIACAGDILLFCRDEEIVIPSNRPVLWVNLKVADMIKNGANGFHVEERPGFGTGINFRWRLKNAKTVHGDLELDVGRPVAGPPVRQRPIHD